MPFDTGSISCRLYDIDESLDASVIEEFAVNVVAPIETLGAQPLSGWVSPRHLLDREITRESCLLGSFVRADLLKAELKIPRTLLKAYCKIEEIAEMKARGVPFLNRQTRAEIKKRVEEDMLPRMPPTLTAVAMALDLSRRRIYIDGMSEKQQDAFCAAFRKTTRVAPVPIIPESAAMRLREIDVRQFAPQCFSPDPEVTSTANNVGMDFLTWLWFFCEVRGGLFRTAAGAPEFAAMLEGPAVFFLEGEGAHETSLRRGMPLVSREAKTAMESGKKLRSVKLTLASGKAMYSATVDGIDFGFRGIKLPKSETPYEPEAAFLERMSGMQTYTDAFLHLYGIFLDELSAPAKWRKTLAEIKTWISNRPAYI
ncbi:MAG: recombination-associated protein RdgC [Kiritimatiellae bacterium]|nr:recombination-associated protein RdgC [Kiritimatiellia bacterium]